MKKIITLFAAMMVLRLVFNAGAFAGSGTELTDLPEDAARHCAGKKLLLSVSITS